MLEPTLTNHLFHYTSAEVGIEKILAEGRIRMSPMQSTNDLWESRSFGFGGYLTSTPRSESDGMDRHFQYHHIGEGLDNHIRRSAKLLCLTQDWQYPRNPVWTPTTREGWSHLALWAHYGGQHSGVCLRFDRKRLLQALEDAGSNDDFRDHGSIEYWHDLLGPISDWVEVDHVGQFGIDALARVYAVKNSKLLFFTKHSDWEYEREYRLLLINATAFPAYLDIRDALTGVFVGDAFPEDRNGDLLCVLERYPNVDIRQVVYGGRSLRLSGFPRKFTLLPQIPEWDVADARARELLSTPRVDSFRSRVDRLRKVYGT